ncbi:hypothetical protein IQ266_04825 [filamentous cyanobacterium LEGE 11480]|uniref:Uncharacterized protein n=1 Tax=Romeriopsis navalis LEGE 11480 TaxID=2777977 RepID=A0A928VN87_9CYAN|nr:hypothetical protein [Romeriopsis navalis]MBE9029084.1 hypothetical protein [Romeriopsis navalis LEGE 11480]
MSAEYGVLEKARLMSPEQYPGLVDRPLSQRKILLWRSPTFSAAASWSVFQVGQSCWLRRLIWNKHAELVLSGLVNSEPDICGCDCLIDADPVNQLLIELAQLSLQPFPSDVDIGGRDGAQYSLLVGNHMQSCQFNFWDVCLPAGWKPLLAWSEKAIAQFEAVLPVRACRS